MSSERTFVVIINPKARDGAGIKRWKKVKVALEKENVTVEEYFTEALGHASELAYSVRERADVELIVAVGGDGTVSEVAAGLRGSKIPLGVVPAGTGNDLARGHGIPHDGKVKKVVDILLNGKDRHCGAFRVEACHGVPIKNHPRLTQNSKWDGEPEIEGRVVRWSFYECDSGITTKVARSKITKAKWVRGSFKYTYLGLREIMYWKPRNVVLKLNDNEEEQLKLGMLSANSTEYFGGGMRPCLGASPIAGHGTVCIVEDSNHSKKEYINFLGALKKGTHNKYKYVRIKPCTRLEIKAVDKNGDEVVEDPDVFIQTDGEVGMQVPGVLQYYPDQIFIRGGVVKWDVNDPNAELI